MENRSLLGGYDIHKILKFSSSFTLILLIFLLLDINPVSEYEASIYEGIPLLFWILLVAFLIVSSIGLLYSRYTNDHLIFIVLLLTGIIIFLSLPAFRGYYLYGRGAADVLAHLGFAQDIINTGQIDEANRYPIVHLYITILYFIGIPLQSTPIALSILFTPLYLIGIYLFSRQHLREKSAPAAFTFCAVPFIYGHFYHSAQPAILSFMMIPLLLFVLMKPNKSLQDRKYVILLLLITTVLALFHPMSTFLMLLILLTYIISKNLYSITNIKKPKNIYFNKGNESVSSLFIYVFILFSLWNIITERSLSSVGSVITGLLFYGDESISQEYSAEATSTALAPIQIIIRFIEMYGAIFIYGIIGGLFISYLFIKILKKSEIEFPHFHLSIQYIVGCSVGVLFLFAYVIESNPIRVARYAILFSTLLVGLSLHKSLKNISSKNSEIVAMILLLLITLTIPLTISTVYQPNNHLTATEHEGVEWLMENQNDNTPIIHNSMDMKMAMYVAGTHDLDESQSLFRSHLDLQPDNDIDSDVTQKLREFSGSDQQYIVSKQYDYRYHQWYDENQREQLRVDDQLRTIQSSNSTSIIYDNGGFEVWENSKI